jgi:hypothetical protein
MPFGPIVQAAISVTSAAQVNAVAKIFASYVEIAEDGGGAAAGLKVTWPNGSVSEYTPAMQPITLGSKEHIGRGPLVGTPVNYNGTGPAAPATLYCQLESMGTTTSVRISEWP